ncbi:MAG: hypothetical protein R3A44_44395 [Caldilineaceae bacterium]
MSLASGIEGATRPAQSITWYRGDLVTPEDLTGATLSGSLKYKVDGSKRAIAGTLTVTDGAAGEFTWAYHADDVAQPGAYEVQFTATFVAEPSVAKTLKTPWQVLEAQ